MKMPEERPYRTQRHKPASKRGGKSAPTGFQVVAVQSIACVVVILIVLLMRMVGGSAFNQLRSSFNESMRKNAVAAALAAWFGDKPGKSTSSNSSDISDSSGGAGTATAPPGAASVSDNSSTVAAMGGMAVPVGERKVLYAPEGATFATLHVNFCPKMPLPSGKITSYFGYRDNPTKEGIGFHMGMDIGAAEGTPISAMYYGTVSETGVSRSYGNYIKLDHGNGLEILFAHCSQVLAEEGSVLRAGETVAAVGSTGDSTGNHLHVEVRLNGIAYDPSALIPLDTYA